MALSPSIEFLASLGRPGGGRLCHPFRVQYLMPNMPPGVVLSFAVAPPVNIFAAFKYGATYSPETRPDTIYIEMSQSGDMLIQGLCAADWIANYMDYFIIYSWSDPLYVQMINTSNLTQRWVSTMWILLVTSERDYVEIIRLLEAYQSKTTTDADIERNNLLQQLIDKYPRIGGR